MNSPQRICPHCKSRVSATARFCGSCGRSLTVSSSDETIVPARRQPQAPVRPARPSRRRRWGWLVGCAVIIVVGVIAVIGLGLAANWFLNQPGWLPEPVSIGDDSPAPTPDIPPTPAPMVLASQTQTVGPEGSVIALDDGSRLVIPAGAVVEATQITLNRLDPQPWLSGDYSEGIALEARAPVDQFQQNVEFRVPLPDGFSPDYADLAAAWLVEEEGGGLIYQPASVQVTDGRPELVVETNHFSVRFFSWHRDWFKGPPAQADPLAIPYFSQGSIYSGGQATGVCWAASLQMITEAVGHAKNKVVVTVGQYKAFWAAQRWR